MTLNSKPKQIISPIFDKNGDFLRQVRSFVRRQGRLTKGQQLALSSYWPIMGLDYQPQPLEMYTIFGRTAPIVLEIGFGMGASLIAMAVNNPQHNFLGIEVHLPGVGACLAHAQALNLTNLRVICHDAVEVLTHMLPDNCLSKVQLFFPDPWHKKRHSKRRIVQIPFAVQVKTKLQPGGILHMATDWQPYSEHMLAVMAQVDGYRHLATIKDGTPEVTTRPLTKFELRGQRLGHSIWDLIFIRDDK